MGALSDIGVYLVQTLFELYLFVVVARFLLQVARADFYNPISQFIVKATNPLLMPIRKVVPGLGGIDLASIVLGIILQVIASEILLLLNGYSLYNPATLALWGLIGLVSMAINIYYFALLASIILSWIAPGSYHPAVLLLSQIVAPVMRPIQAIIPSLGGLDISPIFAFIAINMAKILVVHAANSVGLIPTYVLGI
jgi:YggT family protein